MVSEGTLSARYTPHTHPPTTPTTTPATTNGGRQRAVSVEVFKVDDAAQLVDFAKSKGIGW
ncbi:hypothetical protein ABZ372_30430, partial [Streptomyces sp. NPDC005921]